MAIEKKQFAKKDHPLEQVEEAPIVFVDGFQGISIEHGVVKIIFFQNINDPTGKSFTRRANMIMTCSLPVLSQIRDTLDRIVNDMKDKGILIVEAVERKEP
jgi:hypothetical protein